ncbi:MAG: tetratricopeptide repeat protein [Candidatus Gastranaerophilaceae bacterium]
MKKIVLLFVFALLSANCASAQGFNLNYLKNLMHKTQAPVAAKTSADGELTPSEQAVLLYNENNLKGSLDVLLGIKEVDRKAQDWVLLGNILQDQNRTSDAIFMYQRAILLNPNFYKPYYNLGNIYLEEEKPYLAIENYRKANKANNQFPYAYYNLGCAYLKIGNLNKAKIAFLKAIELKNTEPNFHYNLAYTYKMLNKPKLSKQYLGFYNKLMENNQ